MNRSKTKLPNRRNRLPSNYTPSISLTPQQRLNISLLGAALILNAVIESHKLQKTKNKK